MDKLTQVEQRATKGSEEQVQCITGIVIARYLTTATPLFHSPCMARASTTATRSLAETKFIYCSNFNLYFHTLTLRL